MRRSWFSILSVAALFGLLALLATLQYAWLGQIGDGEQARMRKNLEDDTKRFAEDFNREIQNAYFTFQIDAEDWQTGNYQAFTERWELWSKKTAYPSLIKDFYFAPAETTAPVLIYDREKRSFIETNRTSEIEKLRAPYAEKQKVFRFDENSTAMRAPVYRIGDRISQLVSRANGAPSAASQIERQSLGALIIVLDDRTIINGILPVLTAKYFSGGEMANYKIAVREKDSSEIVFQNRGEPSEQSDASAGLFNLAPGDFSFMLNRIATPSKPDNGDKQNVIIAQRFERAAKLVNAENPKVKTFDIKVERHEQPRIAIFNEENSKDEAGAWTLEVRHDDGSLPQFIARTRRKNLALSFGILTLLGVCVVLVFASAQRVKTLARRQVDFVSSVSHEFRTPLAVIYSAGENLSDGVVGSENQITQYGGLIKREGKKLSQMVEQILEFAGARSGRRKYDLRDTRIETIIDDALEACRPLIEEKDFTIETDITENLTEISADAGTFSHALQNLIVNAVKYSDGDKRIKISACNAGNRIKIAVEDHGIGIAPRDIKNIFEPFYRAKSVVDAQIHGNGLGLSLVKQTVKAHGGRVSVTSRTGEGSRFVIEMPRKSRKVER